LGNGRKSAHFGTVTLVDSLPQYISDVADEPLTAKVFPLHDLPFILQ
jgi:hypothetical protein